MINYGKRNNIQKRRVHAQKTQDQFSKDTGICIGNIRLIESNKKEMNAKQALIFSKYFNVTISQLFDD